MSSGRAADVLIGPAGTGKSHTVGVLAETWRQQLGGRVIGLATSQIAAMELADNGLEAMNTTRFLSTFAGHPPGAAGERLRPGDLVVLDEVGMTSTAELAQISQLVQAHGGKLLYTGDHEQLGAIGAGGMLQLLVADNGCFELAEVHRFTHTWERAASPRLRAGDTEVLDAYESHGRLVGGTIEDLTDVCVRAYLADTITGHQSLLVVGSNAQATELSGLIHHELVRLGHIDPRVLCATRDGNPIAVGAIIQARRNDTTIHVDGGGMVTNRLTYRVLSRDHNTGVVHVADPQGRVAHLPLEYVAEHVTLAYASTVHAAQGRTVDTCHALIDPACDRRSAYVALTRGRQANTAYVVCERDPDGHLPERLASTARAQMAAVLTHLDYDATQAAEVARRAGINEAASLAWIATHWDLVTGEICRDQCTRTLTALLEPAIAHTLLVEPGYPRLVRAVRSPQLAGHDPDALLTEALASRTLFGANSMSDVLRWRLSIATTARIPERDTTGAGWAAMTPAADGPVGEYLLALAEVADTRQHQLGHEAAAKQSDWAVRHLGPAPAHPRDRDEWTRRAGAIAAYRDLTGLPEDSTSLGSAPSCEQVLHRALWNRAQAAAGAPTEELDYTTATETQLRRIRAVHERQRQSAPPWVHDELSDAQLAADGYQRDAVLWQAEAQLLSPGTPERSRADADVHSARELAATYQARVDHLQVIDAARHRWHRDTETARTQHEQAGDELARRGLPRDLKPEPAEQLPQLGLLAKGLARTDHEHRVPTPLAATNGAELGHAVANQSHQSEPFNLMPEVRDVAAATALHQTDDSAPRSNATQVGLGEARHPAEIVSALRAQRAGFGDALAQLEHQVVSQPGHDEHLAYLHRTQDAAQTGQDHGYDLDLGAEH